MALSSRCIIGALNKSSTLQSILYSQIRCVSLAPRKITPPAAESHDGRNARLHRPLSPHITIYKFELPANLSISHRFTGLALASYVYGAAVVSLFSSKQFPQVVQSLQGLDPALIYSAKFLIAFPFAYHFVNGIRHLIWDTGRALTIKGVYTSGYTMLSIATLLTIYLCQL